MKDLNLFQQAEIFSKFSNKFQKNEQYKLFNLDLKIVKEIFFNNREYKINEQFQLLNQNSNFKKEIIIDSGEYEIKQELQENFLENFDFLFDKVPC